MHSHSHHHVLQLDIQGTPQAWISLEHAASHVAADAVAWVDGEGPLARLRGGFNVALGRQSVIDVHPIIALHGASRVNLFDVVPAFSKNKLFRRDRLTCAYCAQRFSERDLQCEHIVPESRGGRWTWMNLVTACALSPPKSLLVHAVSEFGVREIGGNRALRTRSDYRLGLPVGRRLQ
jgi:hypothetical protein